MNAATGREWRVAAVILAAGRAVRMGGLNKLIADIEGRPMVRRVAEAALASGAGPVVVVTGHQDAAVREALTGLDLDFVYNTRFADGLSTSIAVGIGALSASATAAIMLLGDMPRVTADHVRRLIAAFAADPAVDAICVPTFESRRGNPVLWGGRYFAEMRALSGDTGARGLLGKHAEAVREVAMDDDGVLLDVDTPAALAVLGDGEKRLPP